MLNRLTDAAYGVAIRQTAFHDRFNGTTAWGERALLRRLGMWYRLEWLRQVRLAAASRRSP